MSTDHIHHLTMISIAATWPATYIDPCFQHEKPAGQRVGSWLRFLHPCVGTMLSFAYRWTVWWNHIRCPPFFVCGSQLQWWAQCSVHFKGSVTPGSAGRKGAAARSQLHRWPVTLMHNGRAVSGPRVKLHINLLSNLKLLQATQLWLITMPTSLFYLFLFVFLFIRNV